MSEEGGKFFKTKRTDRWPSKVQTLATLYEKECTEARSLLDQLTRYLLDRSYNSSSDSFMKKMRELNEAIFTVMEFNKTVEKLIPDDNKFDHDGSDSESLYSCFDQPSQKSLNINQWINKNGKCSPKQTKQEVLQEQSIHITDHRGSAPQNDDLQKLAERSTHQDVKFDNKVPVQIEKYDHSVATNVLAVEIEESDKSIAANDLIVENQDETPFVFKCRPIEDLIDGDSEPIPETNSGSAGTSVRSESSLDDDSARNSTSEDIAELNIPPQIPLEMNINMDCLVTHVDSPSRFYVVPRAAKSSLDMLMKDKECNERFDYTAKCELSYNIYYTCLYDRTWSRVQLIDLLNSDTDDVEVFFIDMGTKEHVKYYNLTPLLEEFYSLPAIAYLCHLYKVTPLTTSNGVWTFAALKYMKNKVLGFPGKIMATEFVNDSYGVLLSMGDNKSTTINLTMIIKNLAHDLNDTPVKSVLPKTPSKDQLTSAHVNIPPTQVLLKKEFIECVVTHVESPSSFYVSQAEEDGMPEKLKSYYQEYKPPFKNSSECTQPFYACLHEDVWWRVLVIDASSAANELTVFFLDSGLKTNINISNVRPLAVEFCNVSPKAFLCHLFRVEPIKEKGGWTNKAIKFMKSKTLNKKCLLSVENNVRSKSEVSNAVILIADSITLNITLIVKNLAQEPDEPSAVPKPTNETPNLKQPTTTIHQVPAEPAQVKVDSPEKIKIDKSVTSIMPQNNVGTPPPSLTNSRGTSKNNRGFISKYKQSPIKSNALENDKNIIQGQAIKKSAPGNDKITLNSLKTTQFKTLEADFQGISLGSPTKGKNSVTSKQKKGNVRPKPGQNSATSNLGNSKVTSGLIKNNVTPSETTFVTSISPRVVNMPVDDVDYSILDQPMGSEMENLNLSRAAQGFTANDEAEVCAHYKGPPDTTCFKGASCKKKHELLHRDGWTIKKISAIVDTKNELKLPPSDTLITISMTQVESCCSFYGHILTSEETLTPEPKLLCDDPHGIPEPLQKLLKTMNGEAALKALKPYSTLEDLPGLGELVAALFPADGLWYRARVLEADSQEVEVLYVDFGNRACLRYEQIARLQPLFGELPVQAVRFVLGNVQIPADPAKALTAAQALFELAQNKRLYALVLSIEVDDLHVILYDTNADDVGILMAEMNLVETKDYKVIKSGDRIISEDAIRLNKTVRCVEQNKKDVILHGVQFNGLFPG